MSRFVGCILRDKRLCEYQIKPSAMEVERNEMPKSIKVTPGQLSQFDPVP